MGDKAVNVRCAPDEGKSLPAEKVKKAVKKNDVVPAYKFKSNGFVGMDLQAIKTF